MRRCARALQNLNKSGPIGINISIGSYKTSINLSFLFSSYLSPSLFNSHVHERSHTHTHTNGNNNNNKKNNKLPCIVVHVVLYSVVLVTIVQCVFWYVFILYIKMNERNLTNFGLYLLVWQENTNQMRWWWSSQWQPSIIVAIEEPYINTQHNTTTMEMEEIMKLGVKSGMKK